MPCAKRSSVCLMIRVIDAEHLQVGERDVWWGEYTTEGSIDAETAALLGEQMGHPFAYERRGFIVRFESGWSVSVIWGSMTYSDNHDHGMGFMRNDTPPFIETPERVELGILHKDREGVQGGDVIGYCDEDDVNFILGQAAKAHTTDSLIVAGHIALFLRSPGDLPSEQ